MLMSCFPVPRRELSSNTDVSFSHLAFTIQTRRRHVVPVPGAIQQEDQSRRGVLSWGWDARVEGGEKGVPPGCAQDQLRVFIIINLLSNGS